MTAIIFDIVLFVVLGIFMLQGKKRGLLLSLCGLLAVIVAFMGASMVADFFAPQVSATLEPQIATALETQLNQHFGSSSLVLDSQDVSGNDLVAALQGIGLYDVAIHALSDIIDSNISSTATELIAAVAASVAESIAYLIIFVISFLIILVLWNILSRAVDLVTRLPGLNALNRTGGALFGLLKGSLLLFLCAWALSYMGTVIPQDVVDNTYILNFFMTTNPLALLTAL